MSEVYRKWGFRQTPFATTALEANDLGDHLLVGRDRQLAELSRRIENPPKVATVEGPNGIGKTSLINVCAFRLFKRHVQTHTGPLIIPCGRTFQLTQAQRTEAFVDEVVYEIAQTLIKRRETILGHGLSSPDATVGPIAKWLNSPMITQWQATVFSFGAGGGSSPTSSEGYRQSGFRRQVLEWLASTFPEPNSGGVLCTIDNLELLETSKNARTALEELRDSLLTLPGLRWVLSGATGITLTVASSPRLEGLLHTPIELDEIDENSVGLILPSRMSAFSEQPDAVPYLPLLSSDFEHLYWLLRGNLRSALSNADNYCMWVGDRTEPQSPSDMHAAYLEWLDGLSKAALNAAQAQLRPRAWQCFEKAVALDGSFSPGQYEEFVFNSPRRCGRTSRTWKQQVFCRARRTTSTSAERRSTLPRRAGW